VIEVTAVIPVHNGQRFVADSVRSVLGQTHPVHECLVVDDGSTDETVAAVRDFGTPVRVIRRPHEGVAAARNAGIRAATGEYVAFLDADDVWLPTKIERQLAALEAADPASAAYTGYFIAAPGLRPRRMVVHSRRGPFLPVELALLVEGPGLGFSFTALVSRAAAEEVGGFEENLSTSADIDFAWRLHCRGGLVGLTKPLAIHRYHTSGQMHRDIARVDHEMTTVIQRAHEAGLPRGLADRGRANLEIHSALTHLLRGGLRTGASSLVCVTRARPARTASLGYAAVKERSRQWLRAVGRHPRS
jgi:glycosyltransferase involved in cell wall biosynthesis